MKRTPPCLTFALLFPGPVNAFLQEERPATD